MSFFKKLSDTFTSKESRFKGARDKYLLSQLNGMGQLDISTFPNGLKGLPISFPSDSPLHKLSLIEEINFPALIEHIIVYGHTKEDAIQDFLKRNNIRIFENFISKHPHVLISPIEFHQIIEESSSQFRIVYEKTEFLPSSALLFDDSLTYDTEGKCDNVFRAFFLLIGFSNIIGMSVFGKCDEIINNFFIAQNSKSFKTLSDFSNANLLKDIYEKNRQLNLLSTEELNRLHNFVLEVSVENDKFIFSNCIDWFKLVLIYNGQSLQSAEENVSNLKVKLNAISKDWAEISRIALICTDFKGLNWMVRFGLLPKTMISIYKLLFQRI